MSEVNSKEFRIWDMKAFRGVLENLQVPKTANAYIPSAKRPTWGEIKERMKRYTAQDD